MLSKIVDLTPSRESVNDMPVLSSPEKPISRWRSLLSLIKKSWSSPNFVKKDLTTLLELEVFKTLNT